MHVYAYVSLKFYVHIGETTYIKQTVYSKKSFWKKTFRLKKKRKEKKNKINRRVEKRGPIEIERARKCIVNVVSVVVLTRGRR